MNANKVKVSILLLSLVLLGIFLVSASSSSESTNPQACATVGVDCPFLPEGGPQTWIYGCEVSVTASWDGTTRRSNRNSCIATPPPGTIFINARVVEISKANGGFSVSQVAPGQKFDYVQNIDESFKDNLDVAAKLGDGSLSAKIEQDYKAIRNIAIKIDSNKQAVLLQVEATADGSVFDRKRGWIQVRVELLVQCLSPVNLKEQLKKRYKL